MANRTLCSSVRDALQIHDLESNIGEVGGYIMFRKTGYRLLLVQGLRPTLRIKHQETVVYFLSLYPLPGIHRLVDNFL